MQGIPHNTQLDTAGFAGGGQIVELLEFGSDVRVRYMVDAQTVTVRLPDRTETFGINDLYGSDDLAHRVSFAKFNDAYLMYASLTLWAPEVRGVRLSYTRNGTYNYTAPTVEDGRFARFVFGSETANSDMPRTGSATYRTSVEGVVVQTEAGSLPAYYPVKPDNATFSANFQDMSVATTLLLSTTGAQGTSGPDRDFGSLSGKGTIAAAGSGFTGSFENAGITGGFSGAFFGPGAVEMGYAFHAVHADYVTVGSVSGIKGPPP